MHLKATKTFFLKSFAKKFKRSSCQLSALTCLNAINFSLEFSCELTARGSSCCWNERWIQKQSLYISATHVLTCL